MSPAVKHAIYTVTSAGLLFAAITCSADTTVNTQAVTASSVTISSLPAVVEPEAQTSPTTANPATSQTIAPAQTAQANSSKAYYQGANGNGLQVGSGAHLLNVTFGLLLIIGLIFGISWFVKRFSQGSFTGNSHLKIIATMPLGTRERIVLVDAGGQQLLLGITPTHINTLHAFDTPIVANQSEANNSDFGRKLMAILQRPNSINDEPNNNNNAGSRE